MTSTTKQTNGTSGHHQMRPTAPPTEPKKEIATIKAPNIITATVEIIGTAPYVQNRFSQKAEAMMIATQEAGSTAKKGRKREAKDFVACFEAAKHVSEDGWCGIPAAAFRNALVSACRLVGFQMTKAKLSIFVLADGFDVVDGTGLVRITHAEPVMKIHPVRLQSGVIDMRARPFWAPGWRAAVRLQFDGDQFTIADVVNLLDRVGRQVGVGEGRPDSKDSCGLGWGLFSVQAAPSRPA